MIVDLSEVKNRLKPVEGKPWRYAVLTEKEKKWLAVFQGQIFGAAHDQKDEQDVQNSA